MAINRVLAITMGDPAGIGPEVCLKSIGLTRPTGTMARVVFGDGQVLSHLSRQAGLALPHIANCLEEALEFAESKGASILHVESLNGQWRPGEVSAETGRASYAYITSAIDAAMAGQVDGVVTAPIHKEALRRSGIQLPGHTEIFERLTGARRSCMMLTSEELTCSFVTTHVGLDQVPGLISIERVLDVIELTHDALCAIKQRPPRLVVCGLNPHAGEHGLFGRCEEERFIMPAVEMARHRGIAIDGPLPPDTAFIASRRKNTDAYICMYHDQGHIPLKALSFEMAVNVTLGLPIVRTSVDHGTALDIAWRDYRADPTSLTQAIELAERLCGTHNSASSPI